MGIVKVDPRHSGIRRGGHLILIAALTIAGAPVKAGRDQNSEFVLKAVLVYKLTKFVQWPVIDDEEAKADFTLCVLGTGPIGKALDELSGRPVGQRNIIIRQVAPYTGVSGCRLLFVAQQSYETVVRESAAMPILTVSDIEHFANNDGMIEISRQRRRLGFRINIDAARAAGLNIAAPLLELATIVD